MSGTNSSITARMGVTLEVLAAEEASGLAPQLDRWLRPGADIPCTADLPLLLGEGACSHRVVLRKAGRIVSHAALFQHRYRLPGGTELEVGVIGGVATDPVERGQGYAGQCIQALQRRARDDALDIVVLWDETEGYYERFGFVRSGREMLHSCPAWALDRLIRPSAVRPLEPRDLATVRALHDAEHAATVRTPWDWLRLLSVPRTFGYVLVDRGSIEAYGIVGKGNDLQGVMHEWAGNEYALPALASGILHRQPQLRELTIMSAPWKANAEQALSFHGLKAIEGVLGMMWLPDGAAIARKLQRPELVELGHDEIVRALFESDAGLPFYLRGLDSM